MGALALIGLGRSPESVLGWYERYAQRLEHIDRAPAGYRVLFEATARDLATTPPQVLLAAELPGLISGWARNAYHPLIRLAYGYRFGIRNEVAAGLAYLRWCGPDGTLERIARNAGHAADPGSASAAFVAAAASRPVGAEGARFDTRLERVIAHPAFETMPLPGTDVLQTVSRLALAAFAATGDFFALHLVTGAHAFRLLYPFAGQHRDALFSLGILAGFAATGARAFPAEGLQSGSLSNRLDAQSAAASLRSAVKGDDEHDIKLADSCLAQAAYFDDPAYVRTAVDYLDRR